MPESLRADHSSARPLRIAWFSALNLSEEGPLLSAYLSDRVLPGLRELCEVELFHDEFSRYLDFPTFHYLAAFERHKHNPFDLFVYQLENCRASAFTRMHLALMPGVVFFHDLLFSDFGPEPILNSPWRAILRTRTAEGEAWPARSAEHTQKGPLGFREAGMSVVGVFMSEKDHGEYRRVALPDIEHALGRESYFLPYPVSEHYYGRGITSVRTRDGEPWRILFGGTPRLEHRAHKLLAALAGSGERYFLHWLVCDDSEATQARALLQEFGVARAEIVTGRSPSRWAGLLDTVDCAVHLHFSVFGHAEPYLSMSMLAGLPCLLSDFGASEYVPDQLALKIEPGEYEAAQLQGALDALSSGKVRYDPWRIARYARERVSERAVVQEIYTLLRATLPKVRASMREWHSFEIRARKSLLAEVSEGSEPMLQEAMKELGWDAAMPS